jgi:hypothetical protein
MNREDITDSLVDARDDFEWDMDLQAAARTRVPVLISASPNSALRLTEAVAGRLSRTDHSIRILSCDVAECGDDLGAAFAPHEAARAPRVSIVLLREVHALTRTGQAVLRRLMARRPPDAPRVFASSSVSLYQRMKDGLFDPDLFYCLNAIHIVSRS